MIAITVGCLLLIIGEFSRRSYIRRRDRDQLPSLYDVRAVRFLTLFWAFLPLGFIMVIVGLIQVMS